MITIEQLIDKIDDAFYKKNDYYLSETASETFAEIVAIEFAKLHVEAALKAASENADAISSRSSFTSKDRTNGRHPGLMCVHLGDVSVDTSSILNAYPLDNIK